MPTTEELKTYSIQLPNIYKAVLTAFPTLSPGRRAGDPLSVSTMTWHLNEGVSPDDGGQYDDEEIQEACRQLAEHGFLELKHNLIVQPTELGEQLIGVVTGQRAPKRTVPALPKPTW